MTVFLAAATGFLAGRLTWLALRPALVHSTLDRTNFRDKLVPTGGGLAVALAMLVVESGRALAGAAGIGSDTPTLPRVAVLLAVVVFALLGLLDDLVPPAQGEPRGFGGHLGALLEGRLTTGATKLAGGGAAALVLASVVQPGDHVWGLVRDGLLIALGANLANLFDRAPGRMLKGVAASFATLAIATAGVTVLVPVAVAVGGGLALLLDDLHERVMMGDTGANALGAAVGLGVVLATSSGVRTAIVAVLLVLNLLSEAVSFSRVIDGFAPLRALDRAGRRP